jgi:hypothetical protein
MIAPNTENFDVGKQQYFLTCGPLLSMLGTDLALVH